VAEYDRTSILDIHGVGPKAIDRLDKALKEQGLSFKNEKLSEIPFELVGDVACDNAPKRRIMLDFLLASALADKTKLSQIVVSNFIWKVPGAFELKSLEDRKSTRLNSSHVSISYAVFCLKKKKL